MNWNKFLTYGDSQQNSFETLCNQLFERYLKRTYNIQLNKFRVINGSGGDGGIEAYGELISGEIIAVQAKWFRQSIDDSEIRQIKNSILTAKKVRSQIKEYIICIPHDVNSLKIGKGQKPTINHEEYKIIELINKIDEIHPDLKLTWWFDNEILTELQQSDNDGVHKFWFDKELISIDYLIKHFKLQRLGWLKERYIPELHGQGLIHQEYNKLCFLHEWRRELTEHAQNAIKDLNNCVLLIDKFLPTNIQLPELNADLQNASKNLCLFLSELKNLENQIRYGNDLYKAKKIEEYYLWDIKLKLEKIRPTNIQKNILPQLIKSLDNAHKYDLPNFIFEINSGFHQSIRLILGEPGTGKTHGLTNCVEIHLKNNSPALIIQAKDSPHNNWTEILSKGLELQNWRKDEILSALESLAIKNDNQKAKNKDASSDYELESTKVLICIDGLEEDIRNEEEWYARIRESESLINDHPRVKFLFSARQYFYNNNEVPQRGIFAEVFLPREGDVQIRDIAKDYFSKEHFNIKLVSYSKINGIDSLFALRLFCEEYRNTCIQNNDQILTATSDLLAAKIDKLNKEFLSTLQNIKGKNRNPIFDSLVVIANVFYIKAEVEHDYLYELIFNKIQTYMDNYEVDLILDYLSDNGFLIRFERYEIDDSLRKSKCFYNITYQSIIEYIISKKVFNEIKNGSINRIPQILKNGIVKPLDVSPIDMESSYNYKPNQRIVQDIINEVFIETNQLVGDNDFLVEGFSKDEIFNMQMGALLNVPKELGLKYKAKIDNLFFGGYEKQLRVLKSLIIPASYKADSVFGAEYLHSILISQASTFERDKLWSGLDPYERRTFSSDESIKYSFENHSSIFNMSGIGQLHLFESDMHNELPLVYAWGLSSIDQKLRDNLRIALTDWAIKSPKEYLKLLKKIFFCGDPQIQEDLSSITLGVASRLKNKNEIKNLAIWSIDNIFNQLDDNRNVIVRQGFRSIVEKAFQLRLIKEEDVKKSRPQPMKVIKLLSLDDKSEISDLGDEYYPITHDLAWYVISKAYESFLEHPYDYNGRIIDNNCEEARSLLEKYERKDLYTHNWTMSVAISYIRKLGFDRSEGNFYTNATHGSKSEIFTYEEKYTWLAVHYIQGYLSDYIPMKLWSEERQFIKDYTQIIDIPNPAESIIDFNKATRVKYNKKWIIKEALSKELDINTNIEESVTNWVNEEPEINFKNWLDFESKDISMEGESGCKEWVALYNHTGLHDSKKLCYTYLDIKACFINKTDVDIIIKILKESPDNIGFITNLNNLHSIPQTSTYCNPSDIVWMSWIDEDEKVQTFYDLQSDLIKELQLSLIKVVQSTIDGENYWMLPSAKARNLLDCIELVRDELKNSEGKTVAINYKKSEGSSMGDKQELVLGNFRYLKEALSKEGLEIVWFVDLCKRRNPLNKSLRKDFHVQKVRKYFCWLNNGEIESLKFWEEKFSNRRDNK